MCDKRVTVTDECVVYLWDEPVPALALVLTQGGRSLLVQLAYLPGLGLKAGLALVLVLTPSIMGWRGGGWCGWRWGGGWRWRGG